MRSVQLRITGSVQGVFFRSTAKQEADARGISGWARNWEDGSVEIHAEGEDAAMEGFIAWCRQGPPQARIENVEIEEVPPEEEGDFTVCE